MKDPVQLPAVVFIIFNRPDYARQVFSAIREARPARLYVIADGPRPGKESDVAACDAARKIVADVDWPCETRHNYAEQNLGSGRRIASGLDWVFSLEETAIVLEDDFVPHPDFFRFCAEMLSRYHDDERVATITGANFLAHTREFPPTESYFFSRYYAIAGWASWRRMWKKFDFGVRAWPEIKQRNLLREIYRDPYARHYFDYAWAQCHRGERPDVWDFQWMFACAINHGLCVVPRVNLTTHIGVIGTHSAAQSRNDLLPRHPLYRADEPLRHPGFILPNPAYDEPFFERNFSPASCQTRWGQCKRRVRAVLDAVTGHLG